MSFPGHHAGSKDSFGEPKGMASQHEVTHPAKAMGEKHTMAGYANVECYHGNETMVHMKGHKGRRHHSY